MEQRSLRSLRRSKFGRAEYTGIATISELKALPKLPNLVNPFWMLPLLGILKLKALDNSVVEPIALGLSGKPYLTGLWKGSPLMHVAAARRTLRVR